MSRKWFNLPMAPALAVLLMSASVANGGAGSQITLSNLDKRAMAAIVLERELPVRPAGTQTVILVSPRTDSECLPDMHGVRFRKLEYPEVRLVSEYIELRFEAHRRDVEVHFLNGNHCERNGNIYRLRKDKGAWRVAMTTPTNLHAAWGACPGCAVGQSAFAKALRSASPKAPVDPKGLVLQGTVLAARCKRGDPRYVSCEADLKLRFSNTGAEPVIILQPYGGYKFWHGGTSLALARSDSAVGDDVYASDAWPSVYNTPEYRQLADKLDQASPPANLTRIIGPAQDWEWETTLRFGLSEENNCTGFGDVEIGWKELQKLSAPLWLRVSYEMWPFNVENFKPGLGGKLRKQWKRYGTLYLQERSSRYWFAHITSQPIELDLRRARQAE